MPVSRVREHDCYGTEASRQQVGTKILREARVNAGGRRVYSYNFQIYWAAIVRRASALSSPGNCEGGAVGGWGGAGGVRESGARRGADGDADPNAARVCVGPETRQKVHDSAQR